MSLVDCMFALNMVNHHRLGIFSVYYSTHLNRQSFRVICLELGSTWMSFTCWAWRLQVAVDLLIIEDDGRNKLSVDRTLHFRRYKKRLLFS